jgi:hypothetical protein
MQGIAFEPPCVAETQRRRRSFKADHPIWRPQQHHPRASTASARPPRPDQIAIARGTASPRLPAGSFPGGFRTTAPGASGTVSLGPSSETLHRFVRAAPSAWMAAYPQTASVPGETVGLLTSPSRSVAPFSWRAAGLRQTNSRLAVRSRRRHRSGVNGGNTGIFRIDCFKKIAANAVVIQHDERDGCKLPSFPMSAKWAESKAFVRWAKAEGPCTHIATLQPLFAPL